MTIARWLPLFSLVAGCSDNEKLSRMLDSGLDVGSPYSSTGLPSEIDIRLDVYPSEVFGASSEFRALPQSTGRFLYEGQSMDLGVFQLRRPVPLDGVIVGTELSPSMFAPQLPGTLGAVDCDVRVHRSDSIQDYRSQTDEDGAFELFLVPQETYQLEIVPRDSSFPLLVEEMVVSGAPSIELIELGSGVPVWGRVDTPAGPASGFGVHLVGTDGVMTAPMLTDEDGFFEIRVSPGSTYSVVSSGRAFEGHPELISPPLKVGVGGARSDITYPVLDTILVDGRIQDDDGSPLSGVTVRFTSNQLNGYEDLEHQVAIEVLSSNDGRFLGQMLPGYYTVEYIPPDTDDIRDSLTPLSTDERIGGGSFSLPTQRLSALINMSGHVTDAVGDSVPFANIRCTEDGFTNRTWSTSADDVGVFELHVSRVLLSCELTPPPDRLDLPLTRLWVDPAERNESEFGFHHGVPLIGTVTLDSVPEALSYVEVTSPDGLRLGSALTDDEGSFTIQVPRL